mgnify:CR=1 FL=1
MIHLARSQVANDADLIFADSKEKDTSRQIPSELDEMDFIPQLTESNEEENPSFLTDREIRILIVEDNPDVSEHIAESLKGNYKILRAENGKQALKVIEAENPELIITDLMMPVMDGLELTNIVKSDLKTCHIPIIMLTAKASQEHKIEGLEVGADSYIPKPFNRKHLQVRVQKLIESKKRIRICDTGYSTCRHCYRCYTVNTVHRHQYFYRPSEIFF